MKLTASIIVASPIILSSSQLLFLEHISLPSVLVIHNCPWSLQYPRLDKDAKRKVRMKRKIRAKIFKMSSIQIRILKIVA